MGQHEEIFTDTMAVQWRSIFTPDSAGGSAAERSSLALVLAMRAMLTVAAPRPPGNIHARQELIFSDLPRVGEAVVSQVTCLRKEVRRERKYVEFDVCGSGSSNRNLFRARMHIIWAL